MAPRLWLELDLLLEHVTELEARECSVSLRRSTVSDAVDSISVTPKRMQRQSTLTRIRRKAGMPGLHVRAAVEFCGKNQCGI